MRILAISFVYNEMQLIKNAIAYYKSQGCEVFVIDNMSTDGTWEWLQENNISSKQVNTNEAFHLDWLQSEMLKVLHEIKPDWFIWFSPDLFHVFNTRICVAIEQAANKGFNQINSPCYCFKNTGEVSTEIYSELSAALIASLYHYAKVDNNTLLISQYSEELKIAGDSIFVPEANILTTGIIFEYGGCKPAHIQEVKLKRRKKAWDEMQLPKNYGVHYLIGQRNNWIFEKRNLTNVLLDVFANEYLSLLKSRLHESK